jgi:hypothetical protein
MTRSLLLAVLCPALLLSLCSSSFASGIWWKNHDGTSGTVTNTWAGLQQAIDNAQGGSGSQRGRVKLCSDVTRSSGSETQISVTGSGNLTVSGGWAWAGEGLEPAVQDGRSTVDVKTRGSGGFGDQKRVMYVNTRQVNLDSLVITRGHEHFGGGVFFDSSAHSNRMTNVVVTANRAGDMYGGGGGIYAAGNTLMDFRVTSCIITNNGHASDGNRMGAGALLSKVGTADGPAVFENCLIKDNHVQYQTRGAGGGLRFVNCPYVLVANCVIDHNQGNGGAAVSSEGTSTPTLFGCLITRNYLGKGQLYAGASDGRGLTIVNCTVLDNASGAGSIWASPATSPETNVIVRLINSVVDDGTIDLDHNSGGRAHIYLQNTTCWMTNYVARCPGGTTSWTNVIEAIQQTDTEGKYRYHSVSEAGAVTQQPEGNRQAEPWFVGPDNKHGLPEYTPHKNSDLVDSGVNRTGSGYTYVDVNLDGNYDKLVDIIVGGTPPGGNHFVYLKDLGGNPRLQSGFVDRGAYESRPVTGTVFMIQ